MLFGIVDLPTSMLWLFYLGQRYRRDALQADLCRGHLKSQALILCTRPASSLRRYLIKLAIQSSGGPTVQVGPKPHRLCIA